MVKVKRSFLASMESDTRSTSQTRTPKSFAKSSTTTSSTLGEWEAAKKCAKPQPPSKAASPGTHCRPNTSVNGQMQTASGSATEDASHAKSSLHTTRQTRNLQQKPRLITMKHLIYHSDWLSEEPCAYSCTGFFHIKNTLMRDEGIYYKQTELFS